MSKSADAFRTISEVAEWLDTPAHVLRFWESKFTQVKPVKRAGGRRYYRPADMRLLGGIKKLLHDDGMTIKGVQKILREQGIKHVSSLCELSLSDEEEADLAYVDEVVEAEPIDTVVPFAKPEPAAAPSADADDVVEDPVAEDAAADMPANVDEAAGTEADEPALVASAEAETPAAGAAEPETALADGPLDATAPDRDGSAETEQVSAPEPASTLPGFLKRSMADRVAADGDAPAEPVKQQDNPTPASSEPMPSALTHLARIQHLSSQQAAEIAPILEQLKARVR